MTVGETLAPIVETTVPFDVVEPLYEASRPYKYGKGVWSWIIKMDPSCNFDEQKRYVDFAADMGYETVLVDALWDTQIGYEGIERLAQYAKSKGVALYLWYNSNGSWNDAPQGPRGIMSDIVKRRKAMKWMQENGVRGIKVDFFGGDKQGRRCASIMTYLPMPTTMAYSSSSMAAPCREDGSACIPILRRRRRFWQVRIFISHRGCATLRLRMPASTPTSGIRWGAWTSEGVRSTSIIQAIMRLKGSKRMTSDVFALATAVLFQSPVQHFALAPNNLTDAPSWAIDFMKNVPTTWDDVRFIDGYPGKYVVLARRHGNDWYYAGVSADKTPVKLTMELPEEMRGASLSLYSDNKDLVGSKTDCKPDKKGKVKITIPANGGFVIAPKQ